MKGNVNPKLVAVLVILAVAFGYLMVLRPQGSKLAEARDERQRAEQELGQLERRVEQKAAAPSPGTDPQAAGLDRAIPPTPQLSTLFRELSAIAAASGMRQTSVTPSVLGAGDGEAGGSMQISLAVTGPADGANAYLLGLATLERLFVVEQFSLQRGAGNGPGAVQLQLSGRVFTTERPPLAEPSG